MKFETNMNYYAVAILAVLLGGLVSVGCGDTAGEGSSPPVVSVAITPESPEVGDTLRLDASGSSDADGDSLVFAWRIDAQPDANTSTLSSGQGAIVQFTPEVAGEYTFEVRVRDGDNDVSARRSIQVVEPGNDPPVADAGPDLSAPPGDEVVLDARASSDADGDALSFSWQMVSRPDGSQATVADDDTALARLTVDQPGIFELTLTVSDGRLEDEDSITVRGNRSPTAVAGADLQTEVNAAVDLDGSGSSDPDGDVLNFDWSVVSSPDGAGAQLLDADTDRASFVADGSGLFIVELRVSDGASEATDRALIDVSPAGGTVSSTLYLSPNGDDANSGSQQEPLKTLGEGLLRASTDAAISRLQMAAGLYDQGAEEYTVEQDLEIVGPTEGGRPIIKGTGDLLSVEQSAFVSFLRVELETEDVAIQVGNDAGVSLIEAHCRASRCVTTGKFLSERGGRVTMRQTTLTGAGASMNGILAFQADELTVVDSTIEGFSGSGRGLYLIDSPATIRDSIIRDNETGIEMLANSAEQPVLILNSQIRDNGVGLRESNSKNITIRGTVFTDNGDTGILARGGAVRLEDSIIESGLGDGIEIVDLAGSPGALVTLRQSTVRSHTGVGIRIVGARSSLDLGNETTLGGNTIRFNKGVSLYDDRPDGATGIVTLNDTRLAQAWPPVGTYQGPNYSGWSMRIQNNNMVRVY